MRLVRRILNRAGVRPAAAALAREAKLAGRRLSGTDRRLMAAYLCSRTVAKLHIGAGGRLPPRLAEHRRAAGKPDSRHARRARSVPNSGGGVGLCAGNLWYPAKIERQLAAARAAPELPGLVYSWFRLIGGESNVIGTCGRHRCEGRAVRQLAYRNVIGTGSAALFNRAALVEAGGYDERLATSEDYLLHLRIARRHPILLVPEHLVGYRRLAGSRSADPREVFDGFREMERLFRAECDDVPEQMWRWARGARLLALTNAQRRWPPYFALLVAAAACDPRRVFEHLIDWGLRHARRLLGAPRAAAQARSYADFPEDGEPPNDPYVSATGRARLRRLDARRFARLARLDGSD